MNRKISSLLALMVLGATLGIHASGDQKPATSASSSSSSFVGALGSGVGATVTLLSVSADRIESVLAFLPNHPYLSLAGTAALCYLFKPRIDSFVTSMNPSLLKTTLGIFFGTSQDLIELKKTAEKTQTALTALKTSFSTLSTEQQENFATVNAHIAEAQKATTETLALIDKKIVEVSTKTTQAGTDIATLTERTENLQKQVETLQKTIESQKQSLALLPTMAHDISDVRTNLQRAAGARWLDSSKSPLREISSDKFETEHLMALLTQRPLTDSTTLGSAQTPAIASSSSAGGPAEKADEASSEEDGSTSEEDEETVSPTRTVASSSASAEKPLSSGRKSPAPISRCGSDAFERSITGGRVTSATIRRNQAVETKKDSTCSHQ